jgi:ParB-like chromosome segregation protein Spo0J
MSFNLLFDSIDITRIVIPEDYLYVRHKRNTCDTIRLTGVMVPLVVKKEGEKYILLDGLERLLCAKELGWRYVPAIVTEDARTDVIRMALNYVRGRVCGIDVLMYTWQLLQTYSPEIIKTILGKSWETLNKYKNVAEHIISLGLSKDDIAELREACVSIRKLITCAYDSRDAKQFMECALSKPRPRLKKVTAEMVNEAIRLEKNPELKEAVDLVEALGVSNITKIAEIVDMIKKTLCSRIDRYKKFMLIEDYRLLKKLCGES